MIARIEFVIHFRSFERVLSFTGGFRTSFATFHKFVRDILEGESGVDRPINFDVPRPNLNSMALVLCWEASLSKFGCFDSDIFPFFFMDPYTFEDIWEAEAWLKEKYLISNGGVLKHKFDWSGLFPVFIGFPYSDYIFNIVPG